MSTSNEQFQIHENKLTDGIIINSMTRFVAIYLERYSFMHSMSYASRPGRDHPSLGQLTTDVL